MKLFDAHCHLQDDALFPTIGNIMARAAAAGVERMAVCGTSSNDWNKIFQCSELFPQIYPMIGIHPWFVSEHWKESFQTFEKMVRKAPNLGIGETGLDSQNKFTNRAEQGESFAAHLDLARELNRPVAVHCVQAWGRLVEILREHPAPRILLHAFGGAPELIPELLELNCWFSFCGSVTNPQAKRVRAAVAAVPADRLLIETDSPDFPLAGCDFPNEPANLFHIARTVADIRRIPLETLAELTFRNAEIFFYV
jgi:TatD DNase family protein